MTEPFDARLKLVQQHLREFDLQAFLVPRVDRYQGEYVVAADERLAWLTGFTGSSGMAIVMPDEVVLMVDGRYTLQACQQVPSSVKVIHSGDISLFAYLETKLFAKATIGYDPWLHTLQEQQQWQIKSAYNDWIFQPVEKNPIDHFWLDRPDRPLNPLFLLGEQFTGKSQHDKVKDAATALQKIKADITYLGTPEAICWLLNIRGSDFPYTPLIDTMAFLDRNGIVTLIIDPLKIPEEIRQRWENQVKFLSETALLNFFDRYKGQKILLHAATTPIWIGNQFPKDDVIWGEDLCALPKACKNRVEQEGMRQAHLKDGLALVRFFCWLTRHSQPLTELDVVDQLEFFRQQGQNYQGPSFPTIAGYGSNGAIVHYRPEIKTNKLLQEGSLLLLDSGGQYLEGTTDITRTITIGVPTETHREAFTRVLKGHIGLANIHFPQGTCGQQLDVLARQPLWEIGADYDHGTGHGVGCFLNVHEGPQRISKYGSAVALQPGMVLSNEPGYYKINEYGIRIENLVLVKESTLDSVRPFYCFETLSLVPIDVRLIIVEWLTLNEREWLNDYHQTIRNHLLPLLEPETAAWLIEQTEPI